MKPFNLEQVKAGAAVVTRDGTPVRIICTDMKGEYPLVGLRMNGEGIESVCLHTKTGAYYSDGEPDPDDLFIAPVKKEAWLNIYPQFKVDAHATRYAADAHASSARVACIKIEWEEE